MAVSGECGAKLRVLELYSGIGGMHWALKESGIPFEVVMAVDINTTANQIYQHNFPDVNLNSFGIEKLSLKKLQSLRPNAILMSPPCQPFSRVGKKGDCDDIRTKSFLHILQLLDQADVKPDYILVENVKGFEVSRTRQLLVDTLNTCRYAYQEYLLTPLQFGIPNSRLRYYLIAKMKSCPNPWVDNNEIIYSLPDSTHDQQSYPGLHHQHHDHSSSPQTVPDVSNIYTCSTRQLSSEKVIIKSDSAKHSIMSMCKNCSEISFFNNNTSNNSNAESLSSSISSTQDYYPSQSGVRICAKCGTNMSSAGTEDTTRKSLHSSEKCAGNSHISMPPSPTTINNSSSYLSEELSDLVDAGRNMRYCEESDPMINHQSRPLSEFMEQWEEEKDFEHLLVSDKDLRQFVVMDVVLPQLKKSTCFTKRYGHYVEGAGSLVQMSSSVQDTRAASSFKSKAVELKNKHDWGEEELSILRRLKLRYFSPREVSNLMCFPKEFEFPQGVSGIQRYRCLGNSLNVCVVAKLIILMTT